MSENTSSKPVGWEYLTFIQVLNEGLAGYNAAYQDFLAGKVDIAGDTVTDTTGQDVKARMEVNSYYVEKIPKLMTPENVTRAFGAAGEQGNEEAIRQLASGIVSVFGELLQWGRDVRACQVPAGWGPLYSALANYVVAPLAEIRAFAADFESRATTILADVAAGRPPSTTLSVTLKITVGDEQVRAFNAALAPLLPKSPPKKKGLFRR
jgi:hypothetical protein